MITDFKTRTVEHGGGALEETDYHINPNNIVHITQILRNMYADPVRAVVREYTSNAIDAHVMAGIDKPIELHMPTVEEPWFSVRDFGGGLDKEDTKELLYGFGSSGGHKRTSNTQIGGFGIGCKCAFAVIDSFNYTVWKDGIKRVWNCFLDDEDMGKAQLFTETEDASSLPGIEVRIPTRSGEYGKYATAIKQVFQYLPVRPIFTGQDYLDIPDPEEAVFESPVQLHVNGRNEMCNVSLTRNAMKSPGLVLGGTLYEVNLEHLNLNVDTRRRRKKLFEHLLVHAPVGLVQLAPNRESLQYSPRTKKVLKALLEAATSEEFLKSFTNNMRMDNPNCATLISRMQILGIDSLEGAPYLSGFGYLKIPDYEGFHLTVSSTWNGYTNRPQGFGQFAEHNSVKLALVHNRSRAVILTDAPLGAKAVKTLAYQLTYKFKDDLDSLYGPIRNRFGYPESRELKVHILPASFAASVPWLTDGSLPVFRANELPSLTTVDVDWHQQPHRRGRAPSLRGPSQKYAQHGKKFSRLKAAGGPIDGSRNSSLWNPCTAKDTKEGVYILIDRFSPVCPSRAAGSTPKIFISAPLLADMRVLFHTEAQNPILPKLQDGLLGIREKDEASIKDNDNFVLLWDYIRDRFNEDVKSGILDVDGFMTGLWFHSLKTDVAFGDRIVPNFMRYVASIVAATETDENVRTAAHSFHWDFVAAKQSTTKEWVKFIGEMSKLSCVNPFRLTEYIGMDLSSGKRFEWWNERDSTASRAVQFGNTKSMKHDTEKEVKRILEANMPMTAMLQFDSLFNECFAKRVLQDCENTFKPTEQAKVFLDMPETYSIMSIKKQKGDE